MEGIIILTVVIAYEMVRRITEAQETKAASEKARTIGPEPEAAVAT
jgi:hypothetical protein